MGEGRAISVSEVIRVMREDLRIPLSPPRLTEDQPWNHEWLRASLVPAVSEGDRIWVHIEANRVPGPMLEPRHSLLLEAIPFPMDRLGDAMDLIGDIVGWLVSHPDVESYVRSRSLGRGSSLDALREGFLRDVVEV